jgi:hypothetical protein
MTFGMNLTNKSPGRTSYFLIRRPSTAITTWQTHELVRWENYAVEMSWTYKGKEEIYTKFRFQINVKMLF